MIPPDYVQRHATPRPTSLDRARLQLLVLESGLAFLGRARAALERGDVGAFVADLARTQDAVLEIAQTMDARSSDLAESLSGLREQMIRRLARGDAASRLEIVDDIVEAYGPIVEAYRRAVHGGP